MSTVAFIPARGGSKGVPGKNIKPIYNKPLIAWSIEQALQSRLIDRVIVSTDDEGIADCSRTYGAEVPFMRPKSISDDKATTESAMLHFCDWLHDNNQVFDNLLLIQATSPVRAPGRFDDAVKIFEEEGYDSMLSVTLSHRFFWKNPRLPEASYDYLNRPRRQDIAESNNIYIETGSFYITKMDSFLKYKNRLCGKIGIYETPEEESYEIDSLIDFNVCEVILRMKEEGL